MWLAKGGHEDLGRELRMGKCVLEDNPDQGRLVRGDSPGSQLGDGVSEPGGRA